MSRRERLLTGALLLRVSLYDVMEDDEGMVEVRLYFHSLYLLLGNPSLWLWPRTYNDILRSSACSQWMSRFDYDGPSPSSS